MAQALGGDIESSRMQGEKAVIPAVSEEGVATPGGLGQANQDGMYSHIEVWEGQNVFSPRVREIWCPTPAASHGLPDDSQFSKVWPGRQALCFTFRSEVPWRSVRLFPIASSLTPSAKCKSLIFYLETTAEMVERPGICFLCSDFNTKPTDSADGKCPPGASQETRLPQQEITILLEVTGAP